jgi:hypothetical protein
MNRKFLIAWIVLFVAWFLGSFVVQPMPVETVVKQIVFDGVLMVILGVLAGWLYRDGQAGR